MVNYGMFFWELKEMGTYIGETLLLIFVGNGAEILYAVVLVYE